MRIHKTRYATLTDDEILKEADRQGFNISELGVELMERLEYMQNMLEEKDIQVAKLQGILDSYR